VTDLIAQAPRARVDQHGDLALAQAHPARGLLVEYAVDDLHLEEVIPRAEGPALVVPALVGAVADAVGVGAFELAARLRETEVALGAPPLVHHVGGALLHQRLELALVEQVLARLADSGGDVPEELVNERADLRLDVVPLEVGPQEADAAIDV